ncbi:MAG: hypothetical protein VKJ66_10555 [Synechococcus sp.]|nr:hypothetical protein [Synechococcus sp.]
MAPRSPGPSRRKRPDAVAATVSGAKVSGAAVPGAPAPSTAIPEASSDVLVSAVLSPYLLTHLHHVLQRAEFGARQEGQQTLAANYARLRQVLCQEARSLEAALEADAGSLRNTNKPAP